MLDCLVACLGDACIYEHNLASLGPCQMVDDMVVHFYCAVLNSENHNYFFASPSIVQLLQHFSGQAVVDQLRPLNLKQYRRVFFPVVSTEAQKKHWSLLIWHPTPHNGVATYLHLDTCGGCNRDSVWTLASAITKFYNLPPKALCTARAPTQTNGYDCGVYVMAMMRHIGQGKPLGEAMISRLTEDYIRHFRGGLAAYIRDFSSGMDREKLPSQKFCEECD
jgi:sentrin-specific protease 8